MVTPAACPGRVPMADHRVGSCFQTQQLCMQLRVATFQTVQDTFASYGFPTDYPEDLRFHLFSFILDE